MNKDYTDKVRVVRVKILPVELYMVMKFGDMVQSGGEAKFVIGEGLVRVNGEVETRKRKKISSGDTITFANEMIQVFTNEQDSDIGL
jgi:ribosome-associated protein